MKFNTMIILTVLSLMMCACAGPKGDAGNQGTAGTNGSVGPSGPSGAVGPQGPKGADGTAITIVTFCPNSIPQYPSVFPEVGLLIDGSIYAVYSDRGGFMTYLPPGVYSSNAVGSACTFTVNANGTITN